MIQDDAALEQLDEHQEGAGRIRPAPLSKQSRTGKDRLWWTRANS
jgi:hypothetical protein